MASLNDKKIIDKYRVKAEIDQSTNDFARLPDGTLDNSFDDYYIKCKGKARIKGTAYRGMLGTYINSLKQGHNILIEFYTTYINKNLDKFNLESTTLKIREAEYKKIYKELEGHGLIKQIEETSGEVTFIFKGSDIDEIAKILKPQTSGKGMSPRSTKNLPKELYKIPQEDLDKYDEAIKKCPTRLMKVKSKGGKLEEKEVIDGLIISRITDKFGKYIKKIKGRKYNISEEMKLVKLVGKKKEFLHFIGMWNEYCEFMKKEIDNYIK